MGGKGIKSSSPALIELAKKLYILQTVGVDISAQHIDSDIQRVADEEYQRKDDGSHHAAARHGAHLVEHRGDNAGGQPPSEQTGIGEDIAELTGNIIQSV